MAGLSGVRGLSALSRVLFPYLASVASVLLAPGGVIQGEAGNSPPAFHENARVCGALAQRYEETKRTMTDRQLNFLLFDAAERGCGSLAVTFLQAGASLEARDRFGNTSLLRAAAAGHPELTAYLIERGSKVDQRNLAGSTALMRAVKASRRKTAKVLLEAGADADALNGEGVTPLAAAAFNGNRKLVKLLLDHGVSPDLVDRSGKGPVVYAAARGFTGIVQALIEADIDVNRRYAHGLTALMWAAGHADDVPEPEGLATVQLLIDRGAQLDLADDRGWTALMTAAQRDHPLVVAHLLAQGADAAVRDPKGRSAGDLTKSEDVRAILAGRR